MRKRIFIWGVVMLRNEPLWGSEVSRLSVKSLLSGNFQLRKGSRLNPAEGAEAGDFGLAVLNVLGRNFEVYDGAADSRFKEGFDFLIEVGGFIEVAVEGDFEIRAGEGEGEPLFLVAEISEVVSAELREDAHGGLGDFSSENLIPGSGAVSGVGIPIDPRAVGCADDAEESPFAVFEFGEEAGVSEAVD